MLRVKPIPIYDRWLFARWQLLNLAILPAHSSLRMLEWVPSCALIHLMAFALGIVPPIATWKELPDQSSLTVFPQGSWWCLKIKGLKMSQTRRAVSPKACILAKPWLVRSLCKHSLLSKESAGKIRERRPFIWEVRLWDPYLLLGHRRFF